MANVLHLNEPSLDEDANTDAFAHIFKTADVNNNGFLSSTEFSRAYDMILALKGKPHRQSVLTHVEAIRYGRLADKYFVSIYTGTVDHINTFQSVVPPRSVQDYSGTLNSLIDMIADDTERNASESSRQNVMWWMDIVCSKRGVSLARELCSVFGLSEVWGIVSLFNRLVKGTLMYMRRTECRGSASMIAVQYLTGFLHCRSLRPCFCRATSGAGTDPGTPLPPTSIRAKSVL